MRILICDDDTQIINEIRTCISAFFKQRKLTCPTIATYSTGDSLLKDTGAMDILFLDIEMPGINGISVGKNLKDSHPDLIIFIVTSYAEYLDDAMRFHVFRYLSKPIDRQRFYRNMADSLTLFHTFDKNIPVETKNGVIRLSSSEIVYIEACNRKVIVHTSEKDYQSVHTMQHWMDILPANLFYVSHKSYLINMKYVNSFDKSLIHLCNNKYHAYLTRRKYTDFKRTYLLYLESTR